MSKVVEQVTYVPGRDDPSYTKWCGHTFQANVAKEIKGDPEGTTQEKLNAQLIESARNNPHFAVGGKQARRSGAKTPKDAKGYLAYFVDWLRDETFEHPEELIARFARDRDLQAQCEVGADDFARIGELFMPRLADLTKANDISEAQLAAMWVNAGYNQLPW